MPREVSLHAHLRAMLAAERELRESSIATERLLREAAGMAAEQALRLSSGEIERRLETLNGEHGRLAELTRTFLRQETFSAYMESQSAAEERRREAADAWRRTVDRQLSEQRGANNRMLAIVTFALAALSVALRFWGL